MKKLREILKGSPAVSKVETGGRVAWAGLASGGGATVVKKPHAVATGPLARQQVPCQRHHGDMQRAHGCHDERALVFRRGSDKMALGG